MKPVRIQRKRTKGWRMPPNTVYVGRGSRWGNPYKSSSGVSQLKAVEFFRQDVIRQAPIDRQVRLSIKEIESELYGKNLACWCPLDQPCHADILLKIANKEKSP